MNKKNITKLIVLILLMIVSNILVFKYCNLEDKSITLSYKLISNKQDIYQVFYGDNTSWTEERSQKNNYTNVKKQQTLEYTIPKEIKELRFDLGNQISEIKISDIKLLYSGNSAKLDSNQFLVKNKQTQIGIIHKVGKTLDIKTVGNDPYITYKVDNSILKSLLQHKNTINDIMVKIFVCIIIDILLLLISRRYMIAITLIRELKSNKSLIWNLAKNDFKTKYAGSYLGVFWAFVQPVITVLTYWFVFQVGFRSAPMNNFPFLLWLVVGLVPWFFFSEAIINATNSMIEYSYLVKKVVFKISILPIVKIVSAFFIHLFFISFTITLFAIYGYFPTLYLLQIIYYTLCIFVLVLGISYITSAIVVFFKDLGQIVAIVLQVGVWFTPIMWNYSMVPDKYQWILKMNPMYYIVEGYRDSFINHVCIWERYNQTIYFWIITMAMFGIGTAVFKKLKVHFADVL